MGHPPADIDLTHGIPEFTATWHVGESQWTAQHTVDRDVWVVADTWVELEAACAPIRIGRGLRVAFARPPAGSHR